jgi:preprotein translocase SecE subunit
VSEASSDKRPFFSIYKPGQGKWLRWGTVASGTLIAGLGGWWLWETEKHVAPLDVQWKALVVSLWLIIWGLGIFRFVNSPKYGEFLIMTESEMRKVAWPSRREVINSTKVVILLTFGLGGILWIVDLAFLSLFKWMGIM